MPQLQGAAGAIEADMMDDRVEQLGLGSDHAGVRGPK